MSKTRPDLRFYFKLFTGSLLICAAAFWSFYGHNWRYGFDYLTEWILEPELMEFSHWDILPLSNRILYTLVFSCIPAAILTLLVYLWHFDKQSRKD